MESQKMGLRARLADEIYTYCAFCIAISTLPALAISYAVVRVSQHLWLKLLSSRYPDLEFIRTDTIRSLLDTHRNQGIINVLLCIKGPLNPDQIKQYLTQHVIDKKDKDEQFMFPRLRHLLVSCWGNYAWAAKVAFTLENHVIVASAVYRGRPVTENNIQEYVSEIVSKYFPSDQPPWQYIIIPCISTETKYYVLIRVHHLLLSGKKSLNIGNFLLVEQIPPIDEISIRQDTQQSPLSRLFPTPSAIPELWGKINENLSNTWNEFVSEYDPIESPRASKTLPGIFHVAGLLLISSVTALRELRKKSSDNRLESPVTATTLLVALQRECKRRNLSVPKILVSPLVTVDPRKWPKRTFKAVIASTQLVFKLPLHIKDEVIALNELRNNGHVRQLGTLTWKYAELAQLCARASTEGWRCLVEIYRAPAMLWTDTIRADDNQRHLLQTASLCGRKVAWWSRPVSRAGVERAACALGVSCTDIAVYAATDALRAFFEHSQSQVPDTVLATARAADEHFLFAFAEGHGKLYKKSHIGGMICLSLPVGATPRRVAAVIENACARQGALWGAWAAQARCGALTRALPSPLARLTLNLLSRRYAVSYAEINAPAGASHRKTLWGQVVEDVLYWRPPQANVSMSLTVVQYAGTVRLCVMTDARLSPAHTVPATRWPVAIEQLVAKVDQEIARIAVAVQVPQAEESTLPNVPTQENATEKVESSYSMLQAPSPFPLSSPPPMRRRTTHH